MIVTDKRDMFDNSMCLINGEGGKNFKIKLINGEVPIRAWRVEKVSKINKRASLFIRQVRVIYII